MNFGSYEWRTLERLTDKVELNKRGCAKWTGTVGSAGAPMMYFGGKLLPTRRVSYELFVGPIPKGRYVKRRCKTKTCVNPQHLYLANAVERVVPYES